MKHRLLYINLVLTSCDAITRNYKALNIDGVEGLDKLSNFEILMLIINQKTEQNNFIRECISKLLFLIFPIYKPAITPRALILQEHCDDGKNIMHMIDVTNFDIFSNITKEKSGRRDSNPRRQPWEGCILPLNYFRIKYFIIGGGKSSAEGKRR